MHFFLKDTAPFIGARFAHKWADKKLNSSVKFEPLS